MNTPPTLRERIEADIADEKRAAARLSIFRRVQAIARPPVRVPLPFLSALFVHETNQARYIVALERAGFRRVSRLSRLQPGEFADYRADLFWGVAVNP